MECVIISISNPITYNILHTHSHKHTHFFVLLFIRNFLELFHKQMLALAHRTQDIQCARTSNTIIVIIIFPINISGYQNIYISFCLLAYFAYELYAHTQNMSVNLTDSFSDSIVFIINVPPL